MIRLNSEEEHSSMFGLLPDAIYLILKLMKLAILIGIIPLIIWIVSIMTDMNSESKPIVTAINNQITTTIVKPTTNPITNLNTNTNVGNSAPSAKEPTTQIEVSKQITPLEIDGNTIRTPNGILYLEKPLPHTTTDDVIYFFRFKNGQDAVCAGSQFVDTICSKVTQFKISEMYIDIEKKIEPLQVTDKFVQTKNGILYIDESLRKFDPTNLYYIKFNNNAQYVCKGKNKQFVRSQCSSVKEFAPNR